MIHTANTVRMLRVLALVLGLALLMWSTSFPGLFSHAAAANVTSASDTLSDSDVSAVSDHAIQFTVPNGVSAGETITITFDGDFTIPGAIDFEDVDLADDGTDLTLAAAPSGATWGASFSGQTLTLTSGTGVIASSSEVVIEIGENATSGASGVEQITNPTSEGSYTIDIAGTMPDSGQVRVAILDDVVVTASVDTILTFEVSGTSTDVTVNGSPTTTATSTTATTLPFETLSNGTSKTLAQELAVTTNAANGFVVTIEQSGNLQSSTGADIDGFIDGAYTDTPTAWTAPAATIGDEDTYGHWGLTSEDDLNTDEFGSDLWVAASTTPRQIFENSGPADGVTPDQGYTVVGFQAEISALQEAGNDYNTTLTYIATPTF